MSSASVSVLLPTTGRPTMARRCVESIVRTVPRFNDLEIIAAIDADRETQAILGPRVAYIDWSPTYRGCSRAWNDALRHAKGDPIVFAADDLIFEPGWLEASLEALGGFPDGWGLVGFNDGHWDGREGLSTHYLMSRRFIVEVLGGVVAWDFYEHSFNDAEVNARARAAGRYAWAEHAHVRHEHWLFGDRDQDATDTRTLANHAASERIFRQREAAGFPTDYPGIITA